MKRKISIILMVLMAVSSCFVSPAIALFMGIALALILGCPYTKVAKKGSKYLLQASVVGLGFGMNAIESLQSGRDGMLITIVSVVGVMLLGVGIGALMHVRKKNAYLIASGTAICGGSAIAAVAPVIDADEDDTSIALACIFMLNALALFIFPPIGHWLGLNHQQFGEWAAIAIHDTSSVVGAGAAYDSLVPLAAGEVSALKVATTIKLTRALWIIPLTIVSMFVFKAKGRKISIPWFIFLFIGAMLLNTFVFPESFAPVSEWIVKISKIALSLTLFLIGCTLSREAIKSVGVRPLVLGVVLWVIISVGMLAVVMI